MIGNKIIDLAVKNIENDSFEYSMLKDLLKLNKYQTNSLAHTALINNKTNSFKLIVDNFNVDRQVLSSLFFREAIKRDNIELCVYILSKTDNFTGREQFRDVISIAEELNKEEILLLLIRNHYFKEVFKEEYSELYEKYTMKIKINDF
jgi:hypothetical protein